MQQQRGSRLHAMRLVRMAAIVLLLAAGLLGAALPVAADPGPSWHGEYYDNVNLAGAPVLVRDDASINFDWGNGSPAGAVPSDRFSVRWTTYYPFDGGDYVFRVTSDDGARLWVDGQILIDKWYDHPTANFEAPRYVSPGYHSVRLEFYENVGGAVIKLWWERGGGSGPVPPGDWSGAYYNNTWLGGGAALVRNEPAVGFDWGYGSPGPAVAPDNFSARWTRTLYFGGGTHTFSATVDDGVRLWVDGTLVIDRWYAQSRTTHTGSIYLNPGNHTVKVEYFEQTGTALCFVSWTGGGTVPPPPPPPWNEVIVDNRDSGFVWGGPTGSWYGRSTGYRGHLNWTWNSRSQVYHWGKWTPNLPQAGNWEAYVYIASQYHGSKSARYRVTHAAGYTDRVVNQNIYSNQWISLGTYYFNAGSGGNVYLNDATGETYGTRYLGFDAVKFVLRGAGSVPPPPPPPPPATPVPGPTPYPGCSIAPTLGFGRIWNGYSTVRSKLGCATEAEKSSWAADEPFQGGVMLWRQDALQAYVLYNNGTWAAFADTWTSAEPETDPGIVPPAGYYQPRRGFGKVWRNNVPVRTALGWATTEERGFYGSTQRFERGMMFWDDARGIYVLYNDGRWERYD